MNPLSLPLSYPTQLTPQPLYREVANQLEALHFLSTTYQETPSDWTLSELKGALGALRPDLDELEESVAAIEEPGVSRRLGIDASEVKSRRQFVDRVTSEVKVSFLRPIDSDKVVLDSRLASVEQRIRQRLPSTSRSPSPVRTFTHRT